MYLSSPHYAAGSFSETRSLINREFTTAAACLPVLFVVGVEKNALRKDPRNKI